MSVIRPVTASDDAAIAVIIRSTLAEFGANKPGTVYYDASTDHLSELFSAPGSRYFIAESDRTVVGGAGIFPSAGLPKDTCELSKMYLLPSARGQGLGKKLIDTCLEFAATAGYTQVYLETMPELRQALKIYQKFGFEYLKGPMGNTGHFGCSLWMLKKLS
jgi:putative acetyltransferase